MKLLCFLRKVFTSRIALALVSLNLVLCVYAFINRPPENVDIRHESWLFFILTILNLPAIFGGGIILFILLFVWTILVEIREKPNELAFTIFQIAIFLLSASFQWALIGYGIDKLLQRRNNKVS